MHSACHHACHTAAALLHSALPPCGGSLPHHVAVRLLASPTVATIMAHHRMPSVVRSCHWRALLPVNHQERVYRFSMSTAVCSQQRVYSIVSAAAPLKAVCRMPPFHERGQLAGRNTHKGESQTRRTHNNTRLVATYLQSGARLAVYFACSRAALQCRYRCWCWC